MTDIDGTDVFQERFDRDREAARGGAKAAFAAHDLGVSIPTVEEPTVFFHTLVALDQAHSEQTAKQIFDKAVQKYLRENPGDGDFESLMLEGLAAVYEAGRSRGWDERDRLEAGDV